jgi:hypothetical protein
MDLLHAQDGRLRPDGASDVVAGGQERSNDMVSYVSIRAGHLSPNASTIGPFRFGGLWIKALGVAGCLQPLGIYD